MIYVLKISRPPKRSRVTRQPASLQFYNIRDERRNIRRTLGELPVIQGRRQANRLQPL
jgi:hypothetical protein